ncbi:hypothetical protein WMY93_027158 [Mugilogobius chulae]|uniref:Uncharacterized protein n=1 Tax=Mugilogobius chulae TaxID=88201 RepID=A0AAW0N321_9GOBI
MQEGGIYVEVSVFGLLAHGGSPAVSLQRISEIVKREMFQRLLEKLQSALAREPLDLDYLEYITWHEFVVFQAFSLQIDGLSELVEAFIIFIIWFSETSTTETCV